MLKGPWKSNMFKELHVVRMTALHVMSRTQRDQPGEMEKAENVDSLDNIWKGFNVIKKALESL